MRTDKKTLFAIAGWCVALAAVAAWGVAYHRVKAFDRKNACDVFAGRAPAAVTNAVAAKGAKRKDVPKTETNKTVRVEAVSFLCAEGEKGTIQLSFTKMPLVGDIRRSISIEPKVADISIETETERFWWEDGEHHRVRLSSKGFGFRRPYTVTVKKDLAFPDGCALDRDFVQTVTRADIRPDVTLRHSGRYLPAGGDRIVALDCINVTNAECAAWRVLPENIVQLLAREERQYTRSLPYWRAEISADSAATEELSAAPHKWTENLPHEPNERCRHPLALRPERGVLSNGVYLVAIRNGDVMKKGRGDEYGEYRLVCLTDIGLCVRRDRDRLRVWVTSLATGRPTGGAEVRLYAANRLPLAKGKTDPLGEIALGGWDARYEPFALVVSSPDGSDAAFMAIRDSMKIGEPLPNGVRPGYLAPEECRAFVWTERGIYRHNEKIMTHVLLRNGEGNAPKPFPVVVVFEDSEEREVARTGGLTDAYGAFGTGDFFAPDSLPSGKWKIKALLPDGKGTLLGEREIKIEEFVPPQVRVKLKDLPAANADVSNIAYKVTAEHLFGGPAKRIAAESLVAFEDAEFAPEGWKGFRFGDAKRGLKPNYTRLARVFTDDNGEAPFAVRLKEEWGRPKAAVRMIVQGSAFETGGRPSVTRESRVLHKYPHYLGSDVPRYLKQGRGTETFTLAQVNPDGSAHKVPRTLKAKLWKLEYVYNLVEDGRGESRWDSQQVRRPVDIDESVAVGTDGTGRVALPVSGSGDYELVVTDEALGLSHSAAFWISSGGDDEVRASLKNPTALAIAADRKIYREGDRPRLTLKCPSRGFAWLSVMRERTLYTRVFEVTNLTQVVELDPVEGGWAPNVDVAVSLVRPVEEGKNPLAVRAHGIASLRIRTRDSEIPVRLAASVRCADAGGSELKVKVEAKGEAAVGERAVVTVVDEGIHLLTNERVPDPIGHFSTERGGRHPLYDIYNRLLPFLKTSGVKTGGDGLAGMMNRVSPVPTRRFKPLGVWQFDVPLVNGAGETMFRLPEFVGEVRVTALAYNRRATGCVAVQRKVSPKLLMLPDAPRFAAPGDTFALTLTLFNRSGGAGEIAYEIVSDGLVELADAASGAVTVADGDSKILHFRAKARAGLGEGRLTYRTRGLGEAHTDVIDLPIRPAVPWEETASVVRLIPGERREFANRGDGTPGADFTRRTVAVSGSPFAELKAAFDYLAEYPHGCLEQTTSRMFPLLHTLGAKAETREIVQAGIVRVASMLRETDFTMWPDCNCPPWDREVSLYAAHFLVEAKATAGLAVDAAVTEKVCALLKRWAYDADTNVAVYACHTLALAGRPEKERLYAFYDVRDRLPLLSRARLARAFVRTGDPKRARELVADAALDPKDVREAAFALMALLEMDAQDPRLARLVLYLQNRRDRRRFRWGTTGENAQALLALGAYCRATGVREGEAMVRVVCGATETNLTAGATRAFTGGRGIALDNIGTGDAYLSLRELVLPEAASVTNRHHLIDVSRRYLTSEGFPADLEHLSRGELLIGEIVLTSDRDCDFSDLVVEELLPACFEPDRKEVADIYARAHGRGSTSWVLRSDVRDDRILAFSKPVKILKSDDDAHRTVFYYAVRVITPGAFVLPGTSVEAMYVPEINAHTAPRKICVKP